MIVGPWRIALRLPFTVYRRAGKDWICQNSACPNSHGKLRRLSDSNMGSCKRCGKSLYRVQYGEATRGRVVMTVRSFLISLALLIAAVQGVAAVLAVIHHRSVWTSILSIVAAIMWICVAQIYRRVK